MGAAEDGESSGVLSNVYVPDGSGHSAEGEDADKYAASAADIINNIGDEYKCLMLTKWIILRLTFQ